MTNPIVVERTAVYDKGQTNERRVKLHHYWCPGCDALHAVSINPGKNGSGAGWDFSGTLECPTYAPSQLTTWRQGDMQYECRCHTFIRDGKIQFLSDCTHASKGQTVPMVPLPDWVVKEGVEDD
jgi:hypothetical protein